MVIYFLTYNSIAVCMYMNGLFRVLHIETILMKNEIEWISNNQTNKKYILLLYGRLLVYDTIIHNLLV